MDDDVIREMRDAGVPDLAIVAISNLQSKVRALEKRLTEVTQATAHGLDGYSSARKGAAVARLRQLAPREGVPSDLTGEYSGGGPVEPPS